MLQKTTHYTALLIATTLLSACGGGGGGDDNNGAQTDSAACFNAGFYRTGTQIKFNQTIERSSGPNATTSITHRVVSQQQVNGVNTIVVDSNARGAYGNTYYSIENGALLYHGYGNLDTPLYSSKQSLEPARRSLIAMAPGQTTAQEFVVTNETYLKGVYLRQVLKATDKRTYVGRETVTTALGQTPACRFLTTTQTVAADSNRPNPDSEAQTTAWIAAEGPYRGLTLKEEVVTRRFGNADQSESTDTEVTETTQVTQFDVQ